MKYLLILIMVLSSPAWATKKPDPKNEAKAYAESNSESVAVGVGGKSAAMVSDSGNSNVTNNNSVNLTDAVNATLDSSNRLDNSINIIDAPDFNGTTSDVKIGDRTIPVPNFSIGAQKLQGPGDKDLFWGAGVTVPLYNWNKSIKTAERIEAIKLREATEAHQANMMQVCLELHKLGVIHEGASPELWNVCKGFEHHNPKSGSHSGYGNARQVSPHN